MVVRGLVDRSLLEHLPWCGEAGQRAFREGGGLGEREAEAPQQPPRATPGGETSIRSEGRKVETWRGGSVSRGKTCSVKTQVLAAPCEALGMPGSQMARSLQPGRTSGRPGSRVLTADSMEILTGGGEASLPVLGE